jgi:hypothetical protein
MSKHLISADKSWSYAVRIFSSACEKSFDSHQNRNCAYGPMAYLLSRAAASLAGKGNGPARSGLFPESRFLCAAGYGEWFDFAKNIFRR